MESGSSAAYVGGGTLNHDSLASRYVDAALLTGCVPALRQPSEEGHQTASERTG